MKYLFTILMSLSVLAPTFAADKPQEKMLLAKKKDHSKDSKPAPVKKAEAKKK